MHKINMILCMESKAKLKGGKREGAGRKPGPNVWVRLPVAREVWATIEADARLNNLTPEQHAAAILARHAAAPLFAP